MKIIIALFTLFSSSVLAWDNGGVKTTITDVTVLQNGAFYIYAEHDLCDGGEVNKVGYVYLNSNPNKIHQTENGVSMLLSTALTAQTTQQPVVIYADNSNDQWGCNMGAIKITR